MTTSPPLDQELSGLLHDFATAQDLLAQGQVMDMQGMDARVAAFCEKIVATDGATRQKLLPQMEQLLNMLNQLETAMQDAAAKLDAGAQSENARRARDAYGKDQ